MNKYQEQFKEVVKGKNFMTPEVVNYWKSKGSTYIAELSTGTGFNGDTLFGLTVVNIKTKSQERNLSRGGFTTLKQVDEYWEEINADEQAQLNRRG